MKVRLSFLVCLIFCCQLPLAVWASAASDDSAQKAEELYKLSGTQKLSSNAWAAGTAKQALASFRSANDISGVAKTNKLLGDCYFAQNIFTEAIQYYEAAFQSWQQVKDLQKQAEALNSLAFVELRKGELLSGISYLTQARNLIGDRSYFEELGQIAAGFAYCFTEIGLPEKALTQHQRAMEYYHLSNSTAYYYRQVMLLGKTHFLLKNYAEALTYLPQAVNHFESLNDQDSQLHAAECREYLSQISLALGQHDLALQYLGPLVSLYTERGNIGDAANVKALTGQIYEQLGDFDRARSNYLEAATVYSDSQIND